MTTSAASNVETWLAKEEAMPLGPLAVVLAGDRGGFSALARGHFVVVVDVAGAIKRIGRILRIRSNLESTTLYFDKLHTVQGGHTIIEVGLSLPIAAVSRVRAEDVAAILARVGAPALTDLPLIRDAVHVRELLEFAVRDDLLGPAGGPHELVVDMSVRDRYLVGKLAPRKATERLAPAAEPAAAAEEQDDSVDENAAP